ncbi:MAG: hypothetical protein EAX96_06160 [Candidatus Lokiarchaeota archaeon]|nr:hypothetical protein [Candidatus Lokiarchaeota archaeon]
MKMIEKKKIYKIIGDNREPSSILTLLKNQEKLMSKKLLKPEECIQLDIFQLDVADYIISEEEGIERKTGKDLGRSIYDGSFFDQIIRLSQTFKKPFLIIEDLESIYETRIDRESLRGIITMVLQKYRVPIIYSIDEVDTIKFLISLLRRTNRPRTPDVLPRKAPKKMNMQDQQLYFLQGLKNTALKKANLLLMEFKTAFDSILAIKNTKIIKNKFGKAKDIEGPLKNLNGFNHKYVEENHQLLGLV